MDIAEWLTITCRALRPFEAQRSREHAACASRRYIFTHSKAGEVSRNVNLLLSRNDALALAGFTVVSPRTPEEAPLLAAEREVDAVIIGHSVEHEARNQIALAVRRLRPACLVIFVYALPDTKGDPTADLSVDVTDGPERLIAALRERYRVRP